MHESFSNTSIVCEILFPVFLFFYLRIFMSLFVLLFKYEMHLPLIAKTLMAGNNQFWQICGRTFMR